jgi:peptide/nickel transport system substrate-binding protein
MQTRYRLKPNLVWHDGTPLTAEDFAFAFRAATPGAGFRTGIPPYTVIEQVTAPDARSLVLDWKGLFPDAGVLLGGSTRFGLVPFPRHILEQAFAEQSREAFQDHPYWGREFIGAGPFKLERWELGSHIEAVAFDQHVLGRPRIDRIRLQFMGDPNTVFANLLAGTVHMSLNSISMEHMLQLKREWGPSNRGTAGYTALSLTTVQPQLKPEYANPPAVRDVRVRRALAHGIDKQTFTETVWSGELAVMESIFDPATPYYPAIERAITRYPYDPRASERLMNDAGFARGPDGMYTSPGEGKVTLELAAPGARAEPPVLAANWRQIGFDIQERALSQALAVDPEVRASQRALSVANSGAYESQQMALYDSAQIATRDNRWRGENRTGYSNPEFDRLVRAFGVTMDPDERVQQRAQIARILTEDLPGMPLTRGPNAHAYLAAVKGVTGASLYTTGRVTWNIERWELQSD